MTLGTHSKRLGDLAVGGCLAPTVADPATGLCVVPTPTVPSSYAPYSCNWFEQLFNPSACASAASPTPVIPTPPPPSTTITVGAPDPSMQGSSYYSGQTTDGQPIYINTPSAQQSQASQVAAATAAAAAGYTDCSTLWNQLTNANCPCTACTSYGSWALIGGAALLALWILSKR